MSRSLLLLLFAAAAIAQEALPPGKGVNFYTMQKEVALGKQMAAEVRSRHTVLDNEVIVEYVRRIGSQLLAKVPNEKPEFSFEVIAESGGSRVQEPLAFPGGFLFVRMGLFMAAHSEAEIAAMLAHSIAHVVERHGTRSATREQITNTAGIPLIYMGGWTSGNDAGMVVPTGVLKFMREYELEADKLAVRLAADSGYDPAALIRYISRVQIDREPIEKSALPRREERIASMTEAIRALPARSYPSTDNGLTRVREEVKRLMDTPPPPAPSLRKGGEQP